MNTFTHSLGLLVDAIWGGPMLFLLLFVGLYQTISLKGLQFRYLGHSLKLVFKLKKESKSSSEKRTKGDLSSFQALMTALAGAIGTGNITGIATAVVLGGFGSLFWMWLISLVGMANAYSEVVLSLRFRVENENGEISGGPMYTLMRGLNAKKLAVSFAFFGIVASIGVGCFVQSNSVADAMEMLFQTDRLATGIVLAILVGAVVLGGIKSIGGFAGVVVPFMAAAYLIIGIVVLVFHYQMIPEALLLIIKSAFTGQAAVGGFVGASLIGAMQQGASVGLFANEAGLGTLPIAGASAKASMPACQGLFAMVGVFISTMIICTITGLVLAVSNVLGATNEAGIIISGAPLAILAFGSVIPEFKYVVLLGLIFFGFTTTIAWAYYGEKCFEYLFGVQLGHFYRWFYTASVVLGALLELEIVWLIAHLMTACMALPNLYAILRLSSIVRVETKAYFKFL